MEFENSQEWLDDYCKESKMIFGSQDIPESMQKPFWSELGRRNQMYSALYVSGDSISNELRYQMFSSMSYLWVGSVIYLLGRCLVVSENDTNNTAFAFHAIVLSSNVTVSFAFILLIRRYIWMFKYYQLLVTGMLGLFITYLVIGDDRVLSHFLGEPLPKHYPNNPIFIVIVNAFLSSLTLYSGRHQIALSVYTFSLYLILLLMTSYPIHLLYNDLSLLLLIFIKQSYTCYIVEQHTRQTYYIVETERSKCETKEPNRISDSSINSAVEIMLTSCNSVKKTLNSLLKVSVYYEVNTCLQESFKRINYIIKEIPSLMKKVLTNSISVDLNEDDKLFINQNYVNESGFSSRQSISTRDCRQIRKLMTYKHLQAPETTLSMFTKFGKEWDFDILFIKKISDEIIPLVGKQLCEIFNLEKNLNVSRTILNNFFEALEDEYFNVPYHNSAHAGDVTHSLLYLLLNSEIAEYTSVLDLVGISIAALAHDVGHKGVSNRYLINSKSDLAYLYNDISVQEQMHGSILYGVLKQPSCNIFSGLSDTQFFELRKMIIELILNTDMSKHFEILGVFRTRGLILRDLALGNSTDTVLIISIALKCADLGHSAKPLKLHKLWAANIIEELFSQGDLEKESGIPVSMYCDRNTTSLPSSQLGFLKNICLPLFNTFGKYIENQEFNENCLRNLKTNKRFWKEEGGNRRFTQLAQMSSFPRTKPEVLRKFTELLSMGPSRISDSFTSFLNNRVTI